MTKHTWTKEYYEIMEFYYWEPQHIGKIKNPKSSIRDSYKMREKLRKMEVSLNHQLNLFFLLAPKDFHRRFFQSIFKKELKEDLQMLSGGAADKIISANLTQPDMMFVGNAQNFFVELKLDSKSSIDQVLKYTVLHALECEAAGTVKPFYMLFIGKGGFENLWKERFKNVTGLKNTIRSYNYKALERKTKVLAAIDFDSIVETALRSRIEMINYTKLSKFIDGYSKEINLKSIYSDSIIRLMEGMREELEFRGLV